MVVSSGPPDRSSQSSTSTGGGSAILVKIMSPSADVPAGLSFKVDVASTIDQLKETIRDALETKPSAAQQKLIYRGKVLEGTAQIGPILIGNVTEKQDSYTVHLVVSPPESPVSTQSTINPFLPRTTPSGPTAPNPGLTAGFNPLASLSQSAPVTTSTTTSTIRNGPNAVTATTTRISTSFSGNASLRNPFLAFGPQAATGGPPAAMSPFPVGGATDEEQIRQRLRQHIRNAQMRGGGQATAGAGTSSGVSLPGAPQPGITIGQSPLFGPRPGAVPSEGAPTATSVTSGNPPAPTSSADNPNPNNPIPPRNPFVADASLPELLRNLSIPEVDPELLRAIASGQPATEVAALAARRRALQESLRDIEDEILQRETPIPPPSQFNSFVPPPPPPLFSAPLAQPAVLQPTILQPLPGAVVAIPPGAQLFLLHDQFGRPQSLLVGPSSSSTFVPQPADLTLQIQQLQRDLRRLNFRTRNVGGVRRPLGAMLRRLRLRAGNYLWLALKLIVFVVLFTGNGGWRRMLYLGSIAIAIFVWQTGLARPLLNAINPPAPRQPPPAPGQPDPAHLAQALLERQEEGPRRVWRAVERCVGLFLASLVPGLHERHVEAVERRQQQVAQEDERREEEEPAEMGGAEVIGGVL